MEGTPKRHRANSLVGERSPETPSPSGGRDGARDDDSGISRPSFLPSPRHHHQQPGHEHGQRHGHVYGHIQGHGHGHGHGHSHGNSSGAGFPKLNPQSPGKTVSLMPPETPKSKNQELFLSPSLDLQSPVHKPFTANQKPIREISNNLKSRLNYAYVKMMHHQKKDSTDESNATTTTTYTVKPSSYSNVFAQDSDTEPESVSFERKPDTKTGAGSVSGSGSGSGHGSANSLLEPGIELIEENSAQAAFLKALQSPKKKQRSLSSTHPKITRTSSSTDDGPNSQPSEVEAIETLMSLSSPHKRRPSGSFELTLPAPTPPPPSMSVPMSASASAGTIERPIAIPNPGKSEAKLGPGSIISTSEQPKAQAQAKTQAQANAQGHAQDQSEVLLGSPKLSKPAKLTLHSEVQTDVETDVESQSDD